MVFPAILCYNIPKIPFFGLFNGIMAGETVNAFEQVLQKYRDTSFSERDKGYRFERLMQSFLKTYPLYEGQFASIWLWNEFPSRADFGSGDKDLGIDLVARTKNGDYWAVQCKCYQEDALIDKPKVDTFLSTSGKSFYDTLEAGKKVNFAYRLWIDTTKKGFNREADNTIQGQTPPVGRLGYYELLNAAVDWQKLDEGLSGKKASVKKYDPLPHQQTAITDVHNYLKKNDRGKLIMACGTGKTFTSLRIAEKETNDNGLVLFLVPSIALLGQTLREWKNQCVKPVHAICICSDSGVSKTDDTITATVTDLALPASTNMKNITRQFEAARDSQKTEGGNIVVFSTYQSIDVIGEVQKTINRQNKDSFLFDLVICDEAHRTTGVKLSGGDESAFIKVHNDKFIKAKKRVYMTATPRIYSEAAQKKAKEAFATLCSMDDPAMYGEEMYRIGFGEAVDKQLLSDYKVIVLTVAENQLDEKFKKSIEEKSKEADIEINAEDTLKIIGCINALSKKSLTDKELFEGVDPAPMRSAVAFNQNIAVSKATAESFNISRDVYFSTLTEQQRSEIVVVEATHVDGTMGAQKREAKLHWLKSADSSKRECRILNNVRCLSEGVDVPSLDAVMFLSARNSQIDVVQSVGRVMRKADGKKYGYIIIPVVVPLEAEPEKVLSSDRFKVVWTVLNALRAHDDRFDATINKIELNKKKPKQIGVTGTNIGGEDPFDDGEGSGTGDKIKSEFEKQLELEFAKLQGLIYARIVKKCGTKPYWEEWAKDVAKIAERHIENITAIVGKEGKAKTEFEKYISGLRKNINPSVTQEDAIEMLAQHIITKPVFEALFEDYSFVKNNTVSKSLQGIIDALNEQSKKEDAKKLERFYISVQQKAEGIDNSEAKQKIIVELYDKFFRTAFPKVTERLGIVYTPVEIVDFIIHSVEDVLQKEFGRSMTDENVHILDPFTGTGTFITRLLQSGIIRNEDLQRKYTKEIHANEIVLLAYYIASINIENVYHEQLRIAEPYNTAFFPVEEKSAADVVQFPGTEKVAKEGEEYTPFPGICLTDTFQLGETKEGENLFSEIFPQNSQRVQEQQKTPLRVIFGNPPYSIGQRSANDNAQNQQYPKLEKRIQETYASNSSATLVKGLYDSYIKAFRWASDRIDITNGGIIAFITNSGWIDKGGFDGMRKYLEKEFSAIYILNLRGSIKGKNGEAAKREGQNVFDIMTGVAITLLIKNPFIKKEKVIIQYYDVGDYLNRKDKFNVLKTNKSFLSNELKKQIIMPNEQGDWINKRNSKFIDYIPLEPQKKFDNRTQSFFSTYAIGVATNRDTWVYNFSKDSLKNNMKKMIDFYNEQRKLVENKRKKHQKINIKDCLDVNPQKISWTRSLRNSIDKNIVHKFRYEELVLSIHRPFTKQYLYYDKPFIESPGIWSQLLPLEDSTNLVICVSGLNTRLDNTSIFISNIITDLNMLDSGTQCFPLYWYEKKEKVQGNLFEKAEDEYTRRDAISDFILDQVKTRYGPRVSREDIFYYVYGILHSPDYRKTFANDLKKMLPRLPLVEKTADFWAFSEVGRKLADLHLNYEEQTPPKGILINGKPISHTPFPENQLVVDAMKFPAKGQTDTIIYNSYITVSNIPAKAYEYVVNGKSAIEWIMERYAVTIHKESGIKNDPNDWAREHENPQYILDLLLSVITVSIKTVDIVAELPKVEWE